MRGWGEGEKLVTKRSKYEVLSRSTLPTHGIEFYGNFLDVFVCWVEYSLIE